MLLRNRGFFSNQRDVNLRLIILSGQVPNSTEILSCPPYLQVSGWSDQSLTCYSDDNLKQGFLSNQADVTLQLMIHLNQFSNSSKISYMSTLSAWFDENWLINANDKVK